MIKKIIILFSFLNISFGAQIPINKKYRILDRENKEKAIVLSVFNYIESEELINKLNRLSLLHQTKFFLFLEQKELSKNRVSIRALRKENEFLVIHMTPKIGDSWTRDFFISLSNGSEMAIYNLPHPNNSENFIPEVVSSNLGINIYNPKKDPSEYSFKGDGNFGGNFIALDKDLLIVGSHLSDLLKIELQEKLDMELFPMDFGWLETGHVDEIFSVIPDFKKGKKDIWYASPLQGLIIKFGNLKTSPFSFSNRSLPVSELNKLCSKVQEFPVKKCLHLIKANLTYNSLIELELKRLKKYLTQKGKEKDFNFIPMPHLFVTSVKSEKYGIPFKDKATSFSPGIINNIFFANNIIIPKEVDKKVLLLAKEKAYKRGAKIIQINGQIPTSYGGGLHCLVNIIRK